MLKAIEVCDYCHKEKDLRDFIIPWPAESVAMGGCLQKPILLYSEETYQKKIVLCDECATKFAKFLTTLNNREGVEVQWESTKYSL